MKNRAHEVSHKIWGALYSLTLFCPKNCAKKKKENASKPCLSHAEIDNEIINNLTAVGG